MTKTDAWSAQFTGSSGFRLFEDGYVTVGSIKCNSLIPESGLSSILGRFTTVSGPRCILSRSGYSGTFSDPKVTWPAWLKTPSVSWLFPEPLSVRTRFGSIFMSAPWSGSHTSACQGTAFVFPDTSKCISSDTVSIFRFMLPGTDRLIKDCLPWTSSLLQEVVESLILLCHKDHLALECSTRCHGESFISSSCTSPDALIQI